MRKGKVYMPRWMRWIQVVLLLPVWLLLAYRTFGGHAEERLEPLEFGIITLFFVGIGVLLWLLSSRRVALYEVEIDEDEDQSRKSR